MQVKDRTNANILIDDQGHLMHCDFSWMLSPVSETTTFMGPVAVDKAPFSLTQVSHVI